MAGFVMISGSSQILIYWYQFAHIVLFIDQYFRTKCQGGAVAAAGPGHGPLINYSIGRRPNVFLSYRRSLSEFVFTSVVFVFVQCCYGMRMRIV